MLVRPLAFCLDKNQSNRNIVLISIDITFPGSAITSLSNDLLTRGSMKNRHVLAYVLALSMIASSAFSAGPNLISYQGQVLTSGGAPVANGSYPAAFAFYPVLSGGAPLWSESGSITTTAGLFLHVLGSIAAIPAGFFANNGSIWLEVTVNGQVQTPRTQITSVGYSQSVNTIDSASGGTIVSSLSVNGSITIGKPLALSGNLNLMSSSSSTPIASLFDWVGAGGGLQLYDETGSWYAMFQPHSSGTGGFYMRNGWGGYAFALNGNNTAGSPFMQMDGLSSVGFDLSFAGNNSVQLPDSAISAQEMLNEPGVVSNNTFAAVTPAIGVMQDLATVTITIPAPGYISLIGKAGEVDLCGTTGSNWVFAQIDETAGGTATAPYYAVFGATSHPTTGCSWGTLNCQRIYFKGSAGTYAFRLEVQQGSTSAGSSSFVYYPSLTAMYFPTSYGSVVTAASSTEAGEFESAVSTSSGGLTPGSGAVASNTSLVDLRELELKISKLEEETQKARTSLAKARLQEQLNAMPTTADDKK